jgi:hypothetical protein
MASDSMRALTRNSLFFKELICFCRAAKEIVVFVVFASNTPPQALIDTT